MALMRTGHEEGLIRTTWTKSLIPENVCVVSSYWIMFHKKDTRSLHSRGRINHAACAAGCWIEVNPLCCEY